MNYFYEKIVLVSEYKQTYLERHVFEWFWLNFNLNTHPP